MNIFSQFAQGQARQKAVAYYRHSAEDKQENSVLIQRELTQKFAEQNNVEIIHEEADEGVTGLLADRPGFQRLLNQWVFAEGAPAFDFILVYDVSRWGRFQNQDEAAHYQYLCGRKGKEVIFVTHGFPKSGEKMSRRLQTAMEREMAAMYSQQLSEKVFYGSLKISEQGYSAGGMPCYGMGRQLLDVDKKPVRILKKGEHKQIANERVTFVPLGDETTQAVRDIFHLFVEDKRDFQEIAAILNERGVPSASGGRWNREKLFRILTNETYTGTRIYNKTWRKLKQRLRNNPRSEWVIRHDAFPGIVSKEIFQRAQDRLWFELEKWKEGEWAIRRGKRIIRRDLRAFLSNKGFGDDEAMYICWDFPVVFSVSSTPSVSAQEWCFVLPEDMRGHEFVLGVGVVPEHSNPIDRFFLIPTREFGVGGVCDFTTRGERYGRYALKSEELDRKIVAIVLGSHLAKEIPVPRELVSV